MLGCGCQGVVENSRGEQGASGGGAKQGEQSTRRAASSRPWPSVLYVSRMHRCRPVRPSTSRCPCRGDRTLDGWEEERVRGESKHLPVRGWVRGVSQRGAASAFLDKYTWPRVRDQEPLMPAKSLLMPFIESDRGKEFVCAHYSSEEVHKHLLVFDHL